MQIVPSSINYIEMADVDYTRWMEPFILKGVTPTNEEIGVGAFVKVYKVKYCGVTYAAKRMHSIFILEELDHAELQQMHHEVMREAYILSTCSHPNIIQFIGMYHTPSNKGFPTLVMELMDCSLTAFVDRDGPISLHSALSILHDVSLGLWYLHSRNPPVIHCNLTPNCVLLNSMHMVAKIAGLEAALEGNKGGVRAPGTPDFMAPEALVVNAVYGLPLDVFSYGGVALYAVVGEWPTPSGAVRFDPETGKKIALSEVERRQQYLDKMIGEAKVYMLRPLVKECLDNDPAVRPTIAVVSTRIQENKRICHSEAKVIYILLKCNQFDFVR